MTHRSPIKRWFGCKNIDTSLEVVKSNCCMVLIPREASYYMWVIAEMTHRSSIKDIRSEVLDSHRSEICDYPLIVRPVSIHVAGPLNQNSTWRDHSIRIQRGGTTQSEFNVAGPLSQNSKWRNHSVRIQPIKGTT